MLWVSRIYAEAQADCPMARLPHNSRKCLRISIILSLLYSWMNCREKDGIRSITSPQQEAQLLLGDRATRKHAKDS